MPTQLGILAVFEFGCVVLTFYVGVYIRFMGDLSAASESVGSLGPRAALYAALVLLAMLSVGLYRTRQRVIFPLVVLRLITALMIGGLASAILYYAVPPVSTGRGTLALALFVTLPSLVMIRLMFYSLVDADRFKRNVIVLGNGNVAAPLKSLCDAPERRSFRLLGCIAAPGDSAEHSLEPDCHRDLASLLDVVREGKIDEIVVAMDDRRNHFPGRELLDCRLEGTRVTEVTTFLERETGRIDLESVSTSWLIYGKGFRQGSTQRLSKRVFDILASVLLLIVTAPILVFVVFAIFLEGGGRGPLLYSQIRVGLYGKPFKMYKFRSMTTDAEKDGRARWASSRDSRVTRVGSVIRRLRIDELPQIVNIFRGEMSFVGPRPERPEFVDELVKQMPFYRERHCVKPGLTGWAQLCYPYGASLFDARQKLQYDLYYAKNRTIALDLLILLQTLEVVIWDRKNPSGSHAGNDTVLAQTSRVRRPENV